MSKPSAIFVVDDEPIIVEAILNFLSRAGYAVRGFTDPETALRACRLEEPALLFSGVIMPGIDGLKLAGDVNAMWPHCPVLLMSGQAEELRRACLGSQYIMLSKPFSFQMMRETVEQLLGDRLTRTVSGG